MIMVFKIIMNKKVLLYSPIYFILQIAAKQYNTPTPSQFDIALSKDVRDLEEVRVMTLPNLMIRTMI